MAKGLQSSTIRSYISAIKHLLVADKCEWDDRKVLLSAITQACKLKNDRLRTCLPIQSGLLETLLFELNRLYSKQPYLVIMYRALFILAYYGMFRIGKVTKGDHTLQAQNVNIGTNKNKLLMLLYTSKTHGVESPPQSIKISETMKSTHRYFCPFKAVNKYMKCRGDIVRDNEELFVFSDHTPVKPSAARKTLKKLLKRINLNPANYNFHSLRIGRSVELFKLGVSIDKIKKIGRWKSNTVYKYLRHLF